MSLFTALMGAVVTVETPIDGQTGVWIKAGGVTISSGMEMTGATVSAGQSQFVYSLGSAVGYSVIGGTVQMSGGLASDVYIESFGYFHISSGARLVGATGGNGCRIRVSSGGVASLTNIVSNGADITVYAGGSLYQHFGAGNIYGYLSSAIVPNAKRLTVFSGGLASNVSISNGQLYISSGGIADDVTLRGGSVQVFSGGLAAKTVLSGGTMTLSGGMASATTVTGGILNVSSGGTATSITVSSGASLTVSSGGSVADMTIDNGSSFVFAGAAVKGVAIGGNANIAARLYVRSAGAQANNVTVNFGGYAVAQYDGAVISGVIVNSGGQLYPVQTGSALDVVISAGGTANVGIGGGYASGVMVLSGGRLYVSSGGTALAVTSNAGATVYVQAGGYIEYVTTPQPIAEPVYGETGVWIVNRYNTNTVYSSAMSMTEVVANGGNVVQVYDSGVIDTLTQAETTSEFLVSVYSGGYISNLTATRVSAVLIPGGAVGTAHLGGINSSCFIISGGSLGELHTTSTTCAVSNGAHVGTLYQSAFGGTVWRADAVCSNAYVYANHFRVSSGAVVSAITVYSGGNLSVYVGGTALGVINSGGSVRVQDGGYIEYATP